MNVPHSKLPWQQAGNLIVGSDARTVCTLQFDGQNKNARYLVLAANHFEALILAAGHAENALLDYIPQLERENNASLNYGHSVLRMLREVLAAIESTSVPPQEGA